MSKQNEDVYLRNVRKKLEEWKSGDSIEIVFQRMSRSRLAVVVKTIIEDELSSFTYDGENDLSILSSAIEVLGELIKDKESFKKGKIKVIRDTRLVDFFFASLENVLGEIINIGDDNCSYFSTLLEAKEKLEEKKKEYPDDLVKKYDNSKKNLESILMYVVFGLKNYSLFNQMLSRYSKSGNTIGENTGHIDPSQLPHSGKRERLINAVNKSGSPLIKIVIQKYLIALKDSLLLGYDSDWAHFQHVFKRIVTDSDFKITEEQKRDYEALIRRFIDGLIKGQNEENKDWLRHEKNKLILGINGQFPFEGSRADLNYSYRIREKFDMPILSEAELVKYNAPTILISDRMAVLGNTERRIYTFDHNPNEIDDAISVTRENGLLVAGVHIADPLAYLIPNPNDYLFSNSSIMLEARSRTESIYYGNGDCIPMFPLELSQDLMSLNAGQDVLGISYYFYFDEITGTPVKTEIKPEKIRTKTNYDYQDYDNLIGGDPESSEVIRDFQDIAKAAQFMKELYLNSVEVYTQQRRVPLSPWFYDLKNTGAVSADGVNVVTTFMIHTYSSIAKIASETGVPFPFRNCGINGGRDKIEAIKREVNARESIDYSFPLLKILDNSNYAYYSLVSPGHEGLEIPFYSHLTSPLRRYADVLGTMSIKQFLIGTYDRDSIERRIKALSQASDQLERYRDYMAREIESLNARKVHFRNYENELLFLGTREGRVLKKGLI